MHIWSRLLVIYSGVYKNRINHGLMSGVVVAICEDDSN